MPQAGKQSAGILLYRLNDGVMEFFLVHPGAPFWKKKDAGAWSIPKGEFTDEDPFDAARRELFEETGIELTGAPIKLEAIKLKSGKKVFAWAVEQDADPSIIHSNNFIIEWPPRSGKMQSFPEIDKAGWFNEEEAVMKLNPAMVSFIEQVRSFKREG